MLYRVELIHEGDNVAKVWRKLILNYHGLDGQELQVAVFEDVLEFWPGARPIEFGDWHGVYEAPSPPPADFPEWFFVEPLPEGD